MQRGAMQVAGDVGSYGQLGEAPAVRPEAFEAVIDASEAGRSVDTARRIAIADVGRDDVVGQVRLSTRSTASCSRLPRRYRGRQSRGDPGRLGSSNIRRTPY